MNPDIKARWVADLRSGRWEQGRGQLAPTETSRCCLGVLCELAVDDGVVERVPVQSHGTALMYGHALALLPGAVCAYAEAGWNEVGGLAGLNDRGATFAEIADVIEAEL